MTVVADRIRAELDDIAIAREKLEKRRARLSSRLVAIEEKYRDRVLSIDELLSKLVRVDQDLPVAVNNGGRPATMAFPHAYRMSMNVSTLGLDLYATTDTRFLTVTELVRELEDARTNTFEHNSGSEYSMCGSSRVWLCDLNEPGAGVFSVRRVGGLVELVTRAKP